MFFFMVHCLFIKKNGRTWSEKIPYIIKAWKLELNTEN